MKIKETPEYPPEKTLRDEFAIAALMGWLATYGEASEFPSQMCDIAEDMYLMADAMLEARER